MLEVPTSSLRVRAIATAGGVGNIAGSTWSFAGDGISDGLGELGLSGANVACQDDERRPVQDGVEEAFGVRMVMTSPPPETIRVDEEAENLGEPRLVIVETHESCEPVAGGAVGKVNALVEEVVEVRYVRHHSAFTLWRSRARPPAA